MAERPTVFIVIAVHNRIEFTRACLRSLTRQTYDPISITVVDDGSTDGTTRLLPREFPSVTFVRTDGDRWWTGATNAGIREILPKAKTGDYILLMNNDTTVDDDFVSGIVLSSISAGGCIIGSVAVRHADRKSVVDAGHSINWLTAKHKKLWNEESTLDDLRAGGSKKQVNVLPGRGMLIPCSVFAQIGLLDEKRLPHYGADYEFSHRALRHGIGLLIDYNSVVYAHETETGLANVRKRLSWGDYLRSFISIRSPGNVLTRWHFARLNCPWYWFVSYFIIDMIRVIGGSAIRQIKQGFR